METSITLEDVFNVADSLNMEIPESVAEEVLYRYEEEQEEDPSANWILVVENILYNLMSSWG